MRPSPTGAAGTRNAWLSSTTSCASRAIEPRLDTGEELVERRAAGGDLLLTRAELLDTEHDARVEEVLTRERVDPDPAVATTADPGKREPRAVGGGIPAESMSSSTRFG